MNGEATGQGPDLDPAHWCSTCVGWFDVPHHAMHVDLEAKALEVIKTNARKRAEGVPLNNWSWARDEMAQDIAVLLSVIEAKKQAVAEWLVSIGYGFDFSSEVPLSDELRWPLAEAWFRHECGILAGETVQGYYDCLAVELNWPDAGKDETE